ncbi:MAG: di-heme enzyme [Gammaproteobacteria bacterium]|nr:di-heme enzyme [Gammaproteobacteria bacterium]
MKRLIGAVAAIAILAIAFWLMQKDKFEWHIAPPLPLPEVPIDNPMSDAKVELGRRLFYDSRLSINGTMSCASCHIQSLAFTDGRARSIGATGEQHPRGAMSLVNSAYGSRLTWANNLLDRLEDQALTPLLGDNPIEMGMAGRESEIVTMLSNDALYASLMREAFPAASNPYSVLNVVRATSAFVRTIVSFDSPYDAFLRGDVDAIDASAKRGMDLFFSERLECFHCHGGFNFTDSSTHADANVDRVGFHNTGLYNIDGNGAYPADNTGLFDMTGERRDMGRFKAPTLRNIAVTAPYMHDGSLLSLQEVIAHYLRGGRELTEGPHAGDGRLSPYKSEFIRGFELSDEEHADLLAFLHALTDQRVITDARWSNPW